ncbi:dUTP diphosphatase [Rubellimicrobium rubrum]|uniref:dUTP diphosphatase n=1 Tax=Rubellimicrobium rubrum TaxID=2585369 RepID=A0A5C4N240_9RHOB|nr:dUTP diphosphatase [Rubellimicrobium rubrum]TNC51904.1 dUTP diphosphatase [Rubellimicrobium rubrum]
MTHPEVHVAWAEGADRSLPLPSYKTTGAAGADLCAHLPAVHRVTGLSLRPGERAAVPTGLRFAIPDGFEGQVRGRSSLGRRGLILPNAPGTIDADYRGEVLVLVLNAGDETVHIAHGDRIAQLVVAPVARAGFVLEDELEATKRGRGGFGSTGRGA